MPLQSFLFIQGKFSTLIIRLLTPCKLLTSLERETLSLWWIQSPIVSPKTAAAAFGTSGNSAILAFICRPGRTNASMSVVTTAMTEKCRRMRWASRSVFMPTAIYHSALIVSSPKSVLRSIIGWETMPWTMMKREPISEPPIEGRVAKNWQLFKAIGKKVVKPAWVVRNFLALCES